MGVSQIHRLSVYNFCTQLRSFLDFGILIGLLHMVVLCRVGPEFCLNFTMGIKPCMSKSRKNWTIPQFSSLRKTVLIAG